MSEPVKSVEIEDVLSSIRRLVSDDHRQPTPRPDEKPKAAPERLVLTDALRVPDPAPEDSVEEGDSAAAEPLVLEAPEPVASDDEPPLEPEATLDAEFMTTRNVAVESSEPAHEAEDGDTASEDTEMVFEPAFEQAAEMTEEATSPSSEEPWDDPSATLYEAAGLSEESERDEPERDEVSALSEDMRPLGDKIAALEEVIGKTDDQWEPDGTGTDDYAGTEVETLQWEDTEPEEPVQEAALAEPDAAPIADEFEAEDLIEDALLDEAALRELVAEIVREELQGNLGERITRNVRKLVRREIHRALAVKDLE